LKSTNSLRRSTILLRLSEIKFIAFIYRFNYQEQEEKYFKMREVFICDAIRTPIGRYGGSLSSVRPDDMSAFLLRKLAERNSELDPSAINDVLIGCANQAGEDNRNIARMAVLLSGLPLTVAGATINRLCGSGMDAVGSAARAIKAGEAELIFAGGVESMSRAPMVLSKASEAFSRNVTLFDTTIGWRFINPALKKAYGTHSMIETAQNIADEFSISREDQDIFAYNSQLKTAKAQESNSFAQEIAAVSIPQRKSAPILFEKDEHPRLTSVDKLASLSPVSRPDGSITAGNASGVNDGAAALIIASEKAVLEHKLKPLAIIKGMDVAGVEPRTMGLGPVPASIKLLKRLDIKLDDIELIELNEAFAAQALGCIRELRLDDNDSRINPLGGAIALGHPLGMSGARLITTAVYQLHNNNLKTALCTMCIGVGQGISVIIERV
jgi:acetyl-CoA acyltransferase